MVDLLVLWLLLLVFGGSFVVQVAMRLRLVLAAQNNFSLDQLGFRLRRFLTDVLLKRRTIAERPFAGVAHAFVFWGFMAFAGFTATEFLAGLGLVDLTGTAWFRAYRLALTPFAVAGLAAWKKSSTRIEDPG